MSKTILISIALAAIVAAASSAAEVSIAPVPCVSPAAPIRVTATVTSVTASARVYFRAGDGAEYYVEMRPGRDGAMTAFVPAPLATTRTVSYRVEAVDAKGRRTSSPVLAVNTSASCTAATLSADDLRASSAIMVGLTSAKQDRVPAGFQCAGVVSLIDADGVLRPHDDCRSAVAQQGAAATEAGKGRPHGLTPVTECDGHKISKH